MPRTSAVLLAVKPATVNDGTVVLEFMTGRDGWSELRGVPAVFRQLVAAVKPAISRKRSRKTRTGRSLVLKPGGSLL